MNGDNEKLVYVDLEKTDFPLLRQAAKREGEVVEIDGGKFAVVPQKWWDDRVRRHINRPHVSASPSEIVAMAESSEYTCNFRRVNISINVNACLP